MIYNGPHLNPLRSICVTLGGQIVARCGFAVDITRILVLRKAMRSPLSYVNSGSPWPGLFIAEVKRCAGPGNPAAIEYSLTGGRSAAGRNTHVYTRYPRRNRKPEETGTAAWGQGGPILAPEVPSRPRYSYTGLPHHPLARSMN